MILLRVVLILIFHFKTVIPEILRFLGTNNYIKPISKINNPIFQNIKILIYSSNNNSN